MGSFFWVWVLGGGGGGGVEGGVGGLFEKPKDET